MTGTGKRAHGAIQRLDNIAIVVDDLEAAKAFSPRSAWSWKARRPSRAAPWTAWSGSKESARTSR